MLRFGLPQVTLPQYLQAAVESALGFLRAKPPRNAPTRAPYDVHGVPLLPPY